MIKEKYGNEFDLEDKMNAISRRQQIMKTLEAERTVSINNLSEEFSVSTMTIRRDLAKLSEEGLITVSYGEAFINDGAMFEYNTLLKQNEKKEEKIRIAKKCLEFINEGESIYLDGGTTVKEIANLLYKKKNIMVVTNSLLAANSIANFKNIKSIMLPGEFRETSMSYMGPLTNDYVKQFKIDTLFLAVEGIDVENGISVPDIADGSLKKALVNQVKNVICVADSSKFNRSFFYNVAPLEAINMFITDNGIDAETLDRFQQKNVSIITV